MTPIWSLVREYCIQKLTQFFVSQADRPQDQCELRAEATIRENPVAFHEIVRAFLQESFPEGLQSQSEIPESPYTSDAALDRLCGKAVQEHLIFPLQGKPRATTQAYPNYIHRGSG